ncbi:hypothetical protein SAMN05216311_12169 [Chitinophaga sp. CF418]|nr:hypothetical protein SAMN05216311_12169 [Chitinophaga sp. CF418]
MGYVYQLTKQHCISTKFYNNIYNRQYDSYYQNIDNILYTACPVTYSAMHIAASLPLPERKAFLLL